jgi:CDP-paratose 2-epimerase
MVEEYADAYGLNAIIDRFGLLTGPYQMAKSDQGVIALWVAAHDFQRPLTYIGFGGAGKQVRDFLHIEDFCELLRDQILNFSLYAGKKFNVGGGAANSLSLIETTRLCEAITGNTIPIGSHPDNRAADVRIYLSDHRAVTLINGWRPQRGAESTLTDICTWLRAEPGIRSLLFPV